MTSAILVAALVSAAVLTWPGPPARRAVVLALDGQTVGDRGPGLPRPRAGLVPTWRSTRSGPTERADTLQTLDRLAAGLAAGLTPVDALDAAVAQVPASAWLLEPAVRAAGQGRSAAAEVSRVARISGDADLARVARAWTVSEATGASLADAVAGATRAGRGQQEHHRQVRAATAGARATVSLLTLLPLGGVAVGALLGVPPARLYGSPLAIVSATTGVCLVLLGRLVVARMVKRVKAL